MRTLYLALAIMAVSLVATSCRSRQVTIGYTQRFTPVTEVHQPRTVASSQPVVQVSYRQEGQTTMPQQPAAGGTIRELVEGGQTPPPPPQQPAVRQESINVLFATDAADLRRYSVVVASLSSRWNAETLQRRLQGEGHHVILAQNERGMFRVIVGSFDNRFQAATQKEELRRRYSAKGSPDFLVRTYGIPFNDLWILARHF